MIDFITYVVQELKAKRLSKNNALSLVQQFSTQANQAKALHPLLHCNTSDLDLQSYSSQFDGSEFFLNDHRVGHGDEAQKVLPGVVYLEMAREAVTQALPHAQGSVTLTDVVWLQPIVVTESTTVVIALFAGEDGQVEFEIYANSQDDEVLHCQGKARIDNQALPEPLNIAELKGQMTRGTLDASQVYPAYRQMGVDFGPGHQGVEKVLQGNEQLLAELKLPASVESDAGQYLIHPSLLDSALQAAVGFYGDLSNIPSQPSLPFALNELVVYGPCPKAPLAYVRHAQGSQSGGNVTKLDIDLCDESGNICVSLRGFTSRQLSGGLSTQNATGTLLVAPKWQEYQPEPQDFTFDHQVRLTVEGKDYQTAAKNLLAKVKNLPLQGQILVNLVIPTQGPWQGLAGLLRTATLENPNIHIKVLKSDATGEQLTKQLAQCAIDGINRFVDGKQQLLHFEDVQFEQPPAPYKEQGVYLITGGLGGLGVIFAKDIVAKAKTAKVILTGRAAANELKDKQTILDGIEGAEYRQLDITDSKAVNALIADITKQHGGLNGILHSAGMNADSFIQNKTETQIDNVFAPKVKGTELLDAATAELDLDFLVLFSSGAAVLGNPGQADYAMANGFMDQFAALRNAQVEKGERKGHTLSINWPLWQDGGMGVDDATAERMFEATGMQPMPTENGLDAFYQSLQLNLPQTLVMQGQLNKLKQALNSRKLPVKAEVKPEPVVQAAPVASANVNLEEQTENFLRKELSGLLKMPAGKIDPNAQLEQYGIDSILTMDLTNKLEKTFGSLSKTLFFEYQTIKELTAYFLDNHGEVLGKLFAQDVPVEPAQVKPPAAVVQTSKTVEAKPASRRRALAKRGQRFSQSAQTTSPKQNVKAEPIAIVGLSGRYPQGWDINDYWQNLKDGKDCVTEVPLERWDWQEYYSEDRNKPGSHYSKWGGFIEGVDEFDPLFFGIVPVGAEYLDPQERLFLQHAWMAIEDAGFTRSRLQIPHEGDLAAQVGVYAGVMYGEYQLFGAQMSQQGNRLGFAGNPASIANRVSYVMNLHGPSMTVDTMCSSSLTAIHIACEDLNQGRTDLALAGGVNVSVHPNKYLMISAGQFISSEGQCQSFGEGGDGYIPAEGVGVVVLQRLSEAQASGQHIYSVIKGSALSHGGKTNGYTVPNPQAQSSAIRRALKAAEVDPRHVSYIEAHGTGTKLGDPIEIAALSQAFKQNDTAFCRIGSAKSNVGHCEAAAGIAGLTKVLLQMRHQQIVPSLHSSKLNPHIDFDRTPFVVNQTLMPWQRPEVQGREVPRIAGISSFGAGGSNAHIIVEEYVDERVNLVATGTVAIVLSARTAEQLRRKVSDLNKFIAANEVSLANVAYTLQVGREAMDERLAILAGSVDVLQSKLSAYLDGEVNIDDVFTGQVKRSKEEMSLINADEDMKGAIDSWIARNKLGKLMELWAKGLELDWHKLYQDELPKFVSLPTYPFARDRYWVDVEQLSNNVSGPATAVIHPLLHNNTSDLTQQSYSTVLTGNEFFLRDHQVKQNKMLPAVAYLEMVRAAVKQALPESLDKWGLEIRNVVWAQPIVANSLKTIHIALAPTDAQHIDFEVYSAVAEGMPQEIIHAQGQVQLVEKAQGVIADLAALQGRMNKAKPQAKKLYSAFDQMGIHYGPAFQAINSLSVGEGELLAQLELPGSQLSELEQFELHPSLLDSALHASMGFSEDLEMQPKEPPLPFALDALTLFAPCKREMYSHVRFSPDSSDAIVKLDIDLFDSKGNLCIQMHGFTSRELGPDEKGKQGLLLAEPVWQKSTGVEATEQSGAVLLCGDWTFDLAALQSALPNCQIETLEILENAYEISAQAAFKLVKTSMAKGTSVQIAIAPGEAQERFAGLAGLIKTAIQELPGYLAQVVLSDALDAKTLASQLNHNITDTLVRYQNGERQVQQWQQLAQSGSAPVVFNNDGVYVITGGFGGLGLMFCHEIQTQAPEATIVLTGRSALDEQKRSKLAELGEKVSYSAVDLTSLDSVTDLFDDIASRFGKISGVLHSAGMTADNLIAKKTEDEVAKVLAPKVTATQNIDAATVKRELDFMVLFSSVSGAMGNVGQADYAMANGFMDKFAGVRNELVVKGERHGHTLSLNWPLWAEGGMQLDEQAVARLEQTTGAVPMQTSTGMSALYEALNAKRSQVLVMEGDIPRMLATIQREEIAKVAAQPVVVSDSKVLGKVRSYLSDLLAELLKMPAHEIQADSALEDYGIDSILAMNLTHQLEQRFGSLSKTLFFEYQTLNQLAGYFAKNHAAHFSTQAPAPAKPAPAAPTTLAKRQSISSIRDKSRFLNAEAAQSKQQVAIVGLAGRYPGADDLDTFWQNLHAGVDSVAEIPADRWDHGRYFNPERNVPGTSYSKWGGFINDVDKFDALFFNISPNEAKLIDPQERLFLQTAWHAMEDAGYSKTGLAGRRVGVYVGVMYGQYELYGAESIQSGQNVIATSSFASIANRVSYFFDFNGPSIGLDTMCSSSLTAMHLAAEGIARGELDAAIAGGVNVTIHPHKYLNLSQGNFVASDGRCRSFGAGGDGYVPGEGVGAVLLKPLNAALSEGDHIYGLVKASSLNHGGKTNGYTVPNPNAQGELIVDALKQANIAPTTLGYLETHGTGTSLGDPIEITGLCKAFEGYAQDDEKDKPFCPIGSVKSNIGHLESAAGIAALTKVLLQMKHGQLVPSLHADTLNPNIDFAATPFVVQRSVAEFKRPSEHPRRSGISSFGAGGANAHLIIEEYVDTRTETVIDGQPQAFVLSATDGNQLNKLAADMVAWLNQNSAVNFTDLVYTSQVGRTALNERLVVLCDSISELQQKLQNWVDGKKSGHGMFHANIKKSAATAGALIAGDAGEIFLKTVMDSRDLDKMAQLWTSGVNIDWQQLYGNVQPKRLTLPLYPFAKERHWIEPVEQLIAPRAVSQQAALIHYAPVWKNASLNSGLSLEGETWLIGADKLDVKGIKVDAETSQQSWKDAVAKLADKLPNQILYVAGKDDFYRLIYLIQALMAHKHSAVRIVCVADANNPEHLALAALLKTLNLENPNYTGRVVSGAIEAQVKVELMMPIKGVEEVRYDHGTRQVKAFEALKPQLSGELPLKQRGVYFITGGLGGLGLIFARYFAEQFEARLVLLGRSKLKEDGKAKIEALEKLGAKTLYVPTDVSDEQSVQAAVDKGLEAFGVINGVIHSAGVNQDAFILNKTPEQLAQVLSAKVAGTINLDAATAKQPLDIFTTFSSVAGAMGNPGQCDYAYANAFMDAFIAKRAVERDGKSLSINWPLWAEGGMQLSEQDIKRTEQHTGLQPLTVAQGLQSFAELLGSEQLQALTLFGDNNKIRSYFAGEPVQTAKPVATQTARKVVSTSGDLKANTYDYLKGLVAEQTGLTTERIDISEPFESFGFDSMMITRFNQQLETDLGDLPKTLLYEYESIEALAEYLLESVEAPLTALLGAGEAVVETEVIEVVETPPIEPVEPVVTVAASEPVVQAVQTVEVKPEPVAVKNREIAIIGLDGRYPQSDDLDDYWLHLKNGDEMVGEVPKARWDADDYFDADPANAVHGKIYSKWGGFVDGVDEFDAEFFNINPLDAQLMDPQERLFLQSAWAVLEDAGYTRESLKALYPKSGVGKAQSADVGVFVGVTSNTYQMLANESMGEMLTPSAMPWSIANRVSYSLNLQGPSMPIDTACSSSLVALHMAAESIRREECRLAIAGGVNLYLHQYKYQSLCNRQMLAKGRKTYSFGAEGDGFVASEGVGCVLLKPLDEAIESRDHIYGVLKGSSYGHCGRANGYSAPNPTAQAQVIREALDDAGLEATNINYIEGHGTGTSLGDSLEVAAISTAFGRDLPEKFRCAIGSVKANIGHGESAAGIAGLTKVLLQLRHGQIAPSINCDPVNPNIDFANAPVRIQRKLSQWRAPKGDIRRAMINSFGAGGVNACVVIEQAPSLPAQDAGKEPQLIVLSAKSPERLHEYAKRLLKHIGKSPSFDLQSLAYTLQVGREAMHERLAFVATNKSELVDTLKAFIKGEEAKSIHLGSLDPRRMRTGKVDDPQSEALSLLAQLWCEGKAVEFELLHTQMPGRISLPSYPFERNRHWVETVKAEVKPVQVSAPVVQSKPAQLHPLISHNASTLKSVGFVSELDAGQWYAKDHQINGQALLPGAAMVEMACVAGTLAGEQKVVSLRDIVWIKPLSFVDSQVQSKIFLKTIGEATEVEVNSLDEDFEPVNHFQCQLHFADSAQGVGNPGSTDLEDLMDYAFKVIDGNELYQTYQTLGFDYGPAFQTVQKLHCHPEYVLAELALSPVSLDGFEDYILHPTLLDGALQSLFGFSYDQNNGDNSGGPNVPFALDELTIYRPLTARCFAHVSLAEQPGQNASGMSRFNIQLLDENGIVLASLKDFYARALPVATA